MQKVRVCWANLYNRCFKISILAYLDSDEETFVDANDGSDDFKSMENERKSGSSRQESFSDEHDAEIFNAEIVTPRGNEVRGFCCNSQTSCTE